MDIDALMTGEGEMDRRGGGRGGGERGEEGGREEEREIWVSGAQMHPQK